MKIFVITKKMLIIAAAVIFVVAAAVIIALSFSDARKKNCPFIALRGAT